MVWGARLDSAAYSVHHLPFSNSGEPSNCARSPFKWRSSDLKDFATHVWFVAFINKNVLILFPFSNLHSPFSTQQKAFYTSQKISIHLYKPLASFAINEFDSVCCLSFSLFQFKSDFAFDSTEQKFACFKIAKISPDGQWAINVETAFWHTSHCLLSDMSI